jgi:hypothetical protein
MKSILVALFAIAFSFHFSQAYLTTSLNFTALTLVIDPPKELLIFELSNDFYEGFSLYDIQALPTGLYAEEFNPSYHHKGSLPKQCFSFPHIFPPSSVTLRLFVSLEKLALADSPPKSHTFSLSLKDRRTQEVTKAYPFTVQLKNLIPTQHYQLHYPKTVEEGKKYYHFFSQSHIDRHLGFQMLWELVNGNKGEGMVKTKRGFYEQSRQWSVKTHGNKRSK